MAIWTNVVAAASGGLLICCSAAGAEAGDPPPLTTDGAHAEAPSPAPPPPASPLPSGLNLPGDPTATGPSPTAPTTPSTGGRVLWATSGATLLKLASDAPSKVDARAVSGLAANEQLVGLSFRKNGALYAVGSTSRLFTLASATASASAISFAPFAEPLAGTAFGFDFDPVTDLARVTSNTAENIRVEAAQGTVTNVDGSVHYMAGDPNVAAVPHVVAVAYAATGTGYAIDTKTGVKHYERMLDMRSYTYYNDPGVSASPAASSKHVFFFDNQGTGIVLEQGAEGKQVARNRIETQMYRPMPFNPNETFHASPVLDGRCLYHRGEQYLYCIGEK